MNNRILIFVMILVVFGAVVIIQQQQSINKVEQMEIVQRYTEYYHDALRKLNVLPPSIEPTASGHIPELRMNRVLLKHISVIGLNVGAYHENHSEGLRDATVQLFALYAAGKIKPVIHARYPLREAAKALRELGDRRTVGKLILEP